MARKYDFGVLLLVVLWFYFRSSIRTGSIPNLLDHCCAAWNKLIDAPWTIMPFGLRDWVHEF